MKRFMQILGCITGVLLLSIVSSLGVYNYMEEHYPRVEDTQASSVPTSTEELVTQVLNPIMTSVDEIVQFRMMLAESEIYDSIFMSVPTDILVNISQVVIGKYGTATKKDIAEEYLQNYNDVYRYIVQRETPPTVTLPSSSDTLKLPPRNKDDTVYNGEHFILVKELKQNQAQE